MSRTIKFRAWDKAADCFVPSERLQDFLTIGVPDEHKAGIFDIHDYRTNRIAIMQYTGLKDKNGLEIYESDICLVEGKKNYSYKFIVYWDEQAAGFTMAPIDDIPDYLNWLEVMVDKLQRVKVIGNIYERPELLYGGAS